MRFRKSPFSSQRKRSQILFLAHTVVFVMLSSVYTDTFSFENPYFFMCFLLSSALILPKMLMEATIYDAFLITAFFKSLCFHLSTLEAQRFQNDAFSNIWLHFRDRFRKPPFFIISIVGRFRVDGISVFRALGFCEVFTLHVLQPSSFAIPCYID